MAKVPPTKVKKFGRSRIPRTTAQDREDGDPTKFFPNGISSTIRAIHKYWYEISTAGASDLSPQKFVSYTNFKECYESICKKYPAAPGKNRTTLRAMVDDLAFGRSNLDYLQLRAFAHFVNMPVSLLILFSQLVSEERMARDNDVDPRQQALDTLGKYREAIDTLQSLVEASGSNTTIFTKEYDPEGIMHLADVRVLHRLSEFYGGYQSRR